MFTRVRGFFISSLANIGATTLKDIMHRVVVMTAQMQVLTKVGAPLFERIIADSDLDGLCAAAVLKAANPEAEVIFGHAALIRAGSLDHIIDRKTAMVDLPFHPGAGWYLDHHQTNRPNPEEEEEFVKQGGVCHWQATPSAARLAYDLLRPHLDLSHLDEIMPIVDDLDSGGIDRDEFLEDGPILQLSRTLSLRDEEHMQRVLNLLASGTSIKDLLADPQISIKIEIAKEERAFLQKAVEERTEIIDRLAVCRMDELEIRTNGYLVTAWAGDRVDACCIIHGYKDGSIDTPHRPALGASFYANSFIEGGQGVYDLSRLATSLDPTGGGHANACGCRIQPPGLEDNLAHWLDMWSKREEVLRI